MHDIFFFTDIHGQYDLYRAIMDYCHEQDPEAMIIFGGDACDRGPFGYKIMKELLENPYVVYLKGNHEEIFVQAAREITHCLKFETNDRKEIRNILYSCYTFDYRYQSIRDSLHNGGIETLTDWIMDGMNMEFIEKIDKLPLTFSTDTCDFCHTCCSYQAFDRIVDAEYEGRSVDTYDREAALWTRSAMNLKWKEGRTIVFGHTPVQLLPQVMNTGTTKMPDLPYRWGAKIDMDTGATFFGKAFVLNVLTMKAQGFAAIDFENKEINKYHIKKIDIIQL